MLHLNGILHRGGGRGRGRRAGVDPGDRARLAEIRRRVGIVFQDPDDQLFMPTVAEDVAFGPANLGLRGAELAERVDEALAAVGMAEHRDRAPHHLSLRPAPAGRRRHRAGHAPGDPGAGRAVVQPGPGQPGASSPRSCGRCR